MNAKQIGPLTGILFVLLVIAAFVVGGETPDVNDSAQKVTSFYVDNDTEQIIAAILLALAGGAFLFFLGSLRRTLRAIQGDEGGLSTVVLIGGVVLVIGISLFAGLTFTLADAADDLPGSANQALNALNSDMFMTLVIGTFAFNLGIALAILRHGGLPRWIGWLALVLAIVTYTPVGFFAFLATAIVIVALSVVLYRQTAELDGPGTAAPAP